MWKDASYASASNYFSQLNISRTADIKIMLIVILNRHKAKAEELLAKEQAGLNR